MGREGIFDNDKAMYAFFYQEETAWPRQAGAERLEIMVQSA
jgi:hypothetical protein